MKSGRKEIFFPDFMFIRHRQINLLSDLLTQHFYNRDKRITMFKKISDKVFSGVKEDSDYTSGFLIPQKKSSFVLFSAAAGIVIWFATFTILVCFTGISIICSKLICILAVLTFWLIRRYRKINLYIQESKCENRMLIRLQANLKYVAGEVFHFIILISVLIVLVLYAENLF